MPHIVFECLVPPQIAEPVNQRFKQLGDLLVRDGKVEQATLRVESPAQFDQFVLDQLQHAYVTEHKQEFELAEDVPGKLEECGLVDVETLIPTRLSVAVTGVHTSMNQLAMHYSRILTPPAQLPCDAVELMKEEQFEVPALCPWSVAIYP
ncbi:MAG: hypothetical protein Q4A31_09180 [Corynebacterium sp.]|uniref:hypothetical protein n=1 Tax=Corynebacterium sp. TaxID=1720 RepID=UPI0026DCCE9C|nr:hypothetical protein [Corynebacterium sp.]MDO4762076.1 hypothetical protein [Corynebacterium sp.]